MYLLQIGDDNEFSLVEFAGNSAPRYAILSHTWGPDAEEVTFQDMKNGTGNGKTGYRKIRFCGKQAASDGIQYFWVDSCCIDKTNSQRLQEAINSMFRWYKNAARCYVYLSDVSDGISRRDNEPSRSWKLEFRRSRWFTRGWTLQELIAPSTVEFFSKEGTCLGNKQSLEQTLHEITGIALEALRRPSLSQFSKNERLSWAAKRETKREEDTAYCLLGIFGVFMPLIYGEGRENAMTRLEEHIDKNLKEPSLSLDKEQKQILIDSLQFEQMDARQMTIKKAHSKTCKWLLKKSEFLDWLDTDKMNEHHGFLWIRGKPGTGKSTLMKFALAHTRKTMTGKVVISFFFNARGEDIEKSTIGTYRSLLLQLLERLPALQCVFDSLEISKSSIGSNYEWSIGALETALEQAIMLLKDCSLVCFIDALDECEEQQIREMIRFFERVGELAVSAGISFQICFSSRHYPNITIQNGISLVLEGQEGHSQDITTYLESELRIGHSKIAQQIRSELQEKASGVFLWVVLVVDILNREYDRGRIHALRRRLHDIPRDLHDLFRDILTRDSHNKDELVQCIQWVHFARHPLSLEELYFAILSGVEPEAVSMWNQDEITQEVMRRFVLDCSKGLTEITTSKLEKNRKVQFISQSVRDFFLNEDGLGDIWSDLRTKFYGQSHERLKQCCLNYMDLDVLALLGIPDTLPKASTPQAADLRKSANEKFPFLRYAAQNVLYHADVAESNGIAQGHFLDSFPLPHWVKLTNLLEKYEVRRHTKQVSLAYLLAEFNMASLLRTRSLGSLCLEIEKERYSCAIFAAAATGSKEAGRVCIEGLEIHQPTCSNDRRRQEQRHTRDAEALVGSGRQFKYSGKRGMLSYAAELGQATMVAYLLDQGNLELDSEDSHGRTSLWLATQRGHEAVVELLLSTKKVDVDKVSRDDETPLYVAAEAGRDHVIQLLVDAGANVNARTDTYFGNALQAASARGFEAVVKILLDAGVKVNAKGGYYGSALQAASARGYEAIVRLLLDVGADVNAEGGEYDNALQAASFYGQEAVVRLLLDAGADIKAQGGKYGNALQAASVKRNKAVVRLPLDMAADVHARRFVLGFTEATAASGIKDEPLSIKREDADIAVTDSPLSIKREDADIAVTDSPLSIKREAADIAITDSPEKIEECLEYSDSFGSGPTWTCTPSRSLPFSEIPLTWLGYPVVIPVKSVYPASAYTIPPPDPRHQFIDASKTISEQVVEDIFNTFEFAIGFYLLINGMLQLIVRDDFDIEHALSHRPARFGGLRISYIFQSITPTAARREDVSSVSLQQVPNTESSASNPIQPRNPSPSIAGNSSTGLPQSHGKDGPMKLKIGSMVHAKVEGARSTEKFRSKIGNKIRDRGKGKESDARFEAKIGLMTESDGQNYVVVSSHMLTQALAAAKSEHFPGKDWHDHVTVVASSGDKEIGQVSKTFDPEAQHFPEGFEHDVSLVQIPPTSKHLVAGIRSPLHTTWLSHEEWHSIKFNTRDFYLLHDLDHEAKSIGLGESAYQMVGQAIFKIKEAAKKTSKHRSSFQGKQPDPGLSEEAWRDVVSRSLLYRVHPPCLIPGALSGTAICLRGKLEDGAPCAKVVGFSSWAQPSATVTRYEMEGSKLIRRLCDGDVAFFGALQAPYELTSSHRIV